MPIDNRTAHFNLPLPNVDNALTDDVQRLRDAITGIDSQLHGLDLSATTKANAVQSAAISTAATDATTKADAAQSAAALDATAKADAAQAAAIALIPPPNAASVLYAAVNFGAL